MIRDKIQNLKILFRFIKKDHLFEPIFKVCFAFNILNTRNCLLYIFTFRQRDVSWWRVYNDISFSKKNVRIISFIIFIIVDVVIVVVVIIIITVVIVIIIIIIIVITCRRSCVTIDFTVGMYFKAMASRKRTIRFTLTVLFLLHLVRENVSSVCQCLISKYLGMHALLREMVCITSSTFHGIVNWVLHSSV